MGEEEDPYKAREIDICIYAGGAGCASFRSSRMKTASMTSSASSRSPRRPKPRPATAGVRPRANVSATWDITSDVHLYAGYQHGFSSGGFNYIGDEPDQTPNAFEPEELDGIEVGLKTTWFDNRLTANAELLLQLLSRHAGAHLGAQTSGTRGQFVSPTTAIRNAGDATIQGGELELDLDADRRPPAHGQSRPDVSAVRGLQAPRSGRDRIGDARAVSGRSPGRRGARRWSSMISRTTTSRTRRRSTSTSAPATPGRSPITCSCRRGSIIPGAPRSTSTWPTPRSCPRTRWACSTPRSHSISSRAKTTIVVLGQERDGRDLPDGGSISAATCRGSTRFRVRSAAPSPSASGACNRPPRPRAEGARVTALWGLAPEAIGLKG